MKKPIDEQQTSQPKPEDDSPLSEEEKAVRKKPWKSPEFQRLNTAETATGFGGFDEDSDTKTAS